MTPPAEPEQVCKDVWVLFHNAQGLFLKCEENAYFREAGVSFQQFLVLQRIQQSDGPVKETDISRYIGRNLNSVTMILDRMVKLKLLTRARDKKDRRAVIVRITPLGKEKLEAGTQAGNLFLDRIMKSFSPEEIKASRHLLEKLRAVTMEELGQEEIAPLTGESHIRISVEALKKSRPAEPPPGEVRHPRRRGTAYSRIRRNLKT